LSSDLTWPGTKEPTEEAIRLLEAGLLIAGENVLLYASLGYMYWEYVRFGIKQEDALAKAEEFAKKALNLDRDSALAYVVQGVIHYLSGRVKEAYRCCKHACAIGQNDFLPLYYLSWMYLAIGRTADAFPLARRVIDLDPLNPVVHGFPSFIHFYLGQFQEATEGAQLLSEGIPLSTTLSIRAELSETTGIEAQRL
jgi:non-specific serine/threonine protein kinase